MASLTRAQAHKVALPTTLAQPAPRLAAAHLASLRLSSALPSRTTDILCCRACSAIGSTSVRLVRSKRASSKKVDGKRSAKVPNVRLVVCHACGFQLREPGSNRDTVDSFPSARKAARLAVRTAPLSAFIAPATISSSSPKQSEVDKAPNVAYPTVVVPSSVSRPSAPTPCPVVPLPTAVETPKASTSTRKKKPQSSLQKMLALSKIREAEEASKKSSSGGLLDWM